MLRNFCEFAPDYPSLLQSLKDPLNLRASEQIIQFPYVLPVQEEKTEEELARIAEKRKEQGKTEQRVPGWGTPCLKAAGNEGDRYCLVLEEEMAIRVVKSGRYL